MVDCRQEEPPHVIPVGENECAKRDIERVLNIQRIDGPVVGHGHTLLWSQLEQLPL